jgi:hypothetical protein
VRCVEPGSGDVVFDGEIEFKSCAEYVGLGCYPLRNGHGATFTDKPQDGASVAAFEEGKSANETSCSERALRLIPSLAAGGPNPTSGEVNASRTRIWELRGCDCWWERVGKFCRFPADSEKILPSDGLPKSFERTVAQGLSRRCCSLKVRRAKFGTSDRGRRRWCRVTAARERRRFGSWHERDGLMSLSRAKHSREPCTGSVQLDVDILCGTGCRAPTTAGVSSLRRPRGAKIGRTPTKSIEK